MDISTRYLNKIFLCLLVLLSSCRPAFAGQTLNPFTSKPDKCITIEEEDGSPSNKLCFPLKVPNGSLTDNSGSYSLSTSAGAGDIEGVTAGAGLSGGGTTGTVSLATDSTEAAFIAAGALTCGAGTAGKMQVHTTPLQYCDNAGTPTLQYAAYGSSTGVATSATALAADPANCATSTHFAVGVDASGVATCEAIGDADIPDSTTVTGWALGASTATTLNKLTLTAPATGSTLTIVDGKTLTVTNTVDLAATVTDEQVCNYEGTGTQINCDIAIDATTDCAAGSICGGGHTHVGGAGDIEDVGDCSTGACFTGASGTLLQSNTDLIMELDNDNDGTESFQVKDGANAMVAEIAESGVINTLIGIDAIGAVDMDYGSADVTDHAFITDGTGDAEVVLPDASIGATELDADSVSASELNATGVEAELEAALDIAGEVSSTGMASTVLAETGIALTSITIGALLGVDSIDATGAVDMDYGSADVTDHTFTADGGTVVLDGTVTGVSLIATGDGTQSVITEGIVVNNGNGTDEDDDFTVKASAGTYEIDAGGGTFISTTNDLGWTIVDQTDNQACTTGCTSACVFGFENATGAAVTNVVSCDAVTADECLCAGPS